jgi:hypothetical protein
VFRHLKGLFPFPELQFSRGELHFKYLLSQCDIGKVQYTVKKGLSVFPSRAGMALNISAGDGKTGLGKTANFFYSVQYVPGEIIVTESK